MGFWGWSWLTGLSCAVLICYSVMSSIYRSYCSCINVAEELCVHVFVSSCRDSSNYLTSELQHEGLMMYERNATLQSVLSNQAYGLYPSSTFRSRAAIILPHEHRCSVRAIVIKWWVCVNVYGCVSCSVFVICFSQSFLFGFTVSYVYSSSPSHTHTPVSPWRAIHIYLLSQLSKRTSTLLSYRLAATFLPSMVQCVDCVV